MADDVLKFLIVFCLCVINSNGNQLEKNSDVFLDISERTVLVGTNVSIYCTLNSSYSFIQHLNSRQIMWYKNGDVIKFGNPKPLNTLTSVLTLKNVRINDSGNYSCRIANQTSFFQLYVGTLPPKPSNITIISHNWNDLNISWTINNYSPYVPTKYIFHLNVNKASDKKVYEINLNSDSTIFNYYLSSTTRVLFMKYGDYKIFIKGENLLGETLENFNITPAKHVIPDPPTDVFVESGSSFCTVLWYYPNGLEIFRPSNCDSCPGLEYRIFYQNSQSDGRTHIIDGDFFYTMNNLQPFTEYTINIAAKPKLISDFYWGKPATILCKTKPYIPAAPPAIANGSFLIKPSRDQKKRNVIVYWQPLPKHLENGERITFYIKIQSTPENYTYNLTTNESKIELSLDQNLAYFVYIISGNEKGVNPNSSKIFIEKSSKVPAQPQNVRVIYYPSLYQYEVSWSPPVISLNILNYTVFWCLASSSECKIMNWITVMSSIYSVNLTNIKANEDYKFAVTADTDSSSSGIKWSSCGVVNIDHIPNKITKYRVDTTSTSMKIDWQLNQCSYNDVKKIKVTYCQLQNDLLCPVGSVFNEVLDVSIDQTLIINKLFPFTKYKVTLNAGFLVDWGEKSDSKIILTKEIAPTSPPLILAVVNVTESSFELTLQPPNYSNGVIIYYEVQWNDNKPVRKDSAETIILNENIFGYTTYSVKVRAHNKAGYSPWSTASKILTPIGYPSKVDNIKITWIKSERQINISWEEPQHPNGPIKYYIVKFTNGYEHNTSKKFILKDIKCSHYIKYINISIAAVNIAVDSQPYIGKWTYHEEHLSCSQPKLLKDSHVTIWGSIFGSFFLIIIIVLCLIFCIRVSLRRSKIPVIVLPESIAKPDEIWFDNQWPRKDKTNNHHGSYKITGHLCKGAIIYNKKSQKNVPVKTAVIHSETDFDRTREGNDKVVITEDINKNFDSNRINKTTDFSAAQYWIYTQQLMDADKMVDQNISSQVKSNNLNTIFNTMYEIPFTKEECQDKILECNSIIKNKSPCYVSAKTKYENNILNNQNNLSISLENKINTVK